MVWTEEQVEIMNVAAKNGLSIEETSASLIEAGYEDRSVRSVRAKWRHMYKAPFGDFNEEEIVIEEITEEIVVNTMSGEEEKKRQTGLKLAVIIAIGIVAAYTWEIGLWTI
jgi:hypothetical protein|tara:strand:+ start:19 stop:351 length:333 start_codon:yes stop_codon:yes gene_type:complete